MRQMEICKKQLQYGENATCTLVYYVTINDLTDETTGIELEAYGVGITNQERGETAVVPNVTFSKTAILELAALLSEHLVTPVTIGEVVEDWLCAS
jgi:hypothetical protein